MNIIIMDINQLNNNILQILALSNNIDTLLKDTSNCSLVQKHLLDRQLLLKTSIDNIFKNININIHYIESLKLHDLRDKLMKRGIKTEDDNKELRCLNERLTFLYSENMDYMNSIVH